MDAKEILEKNKKAHPEDEGMVFHENRARIIASACVMILILVQLVYNLFKGISSYSLQAVLWGYIGVEAFLKYRFSKNKLYLATGIAGSLASIVFVIDHIMYTW